MAAKILSSHRRSWTAYRGFLRRIRNLCWRFRRGWGKIESIKCLNASHKALLLCGAYKNRVTLFGSSKHNSTFLGNTKTPPAALSSDNKKSHDGRRPSRRVTGLEPTASASRTQRSTKLSHTSKYHCNIISHPSNLVKAFFSVLYPLCSFLLR